MEKEVSHLEEFLTAFLIFCGYGVLFLLLFLIIANFIMKYEIFGIKNPE